MDTGKVRGEVRNWSLSPAHPRRLRDHAVMADTLAEIKRKMATNADLLLLRRCTLEKGKGTGGQSGGREKWRKCGGDSYKTRRRGKGFYENT